MEDFYTGILPLLLLFTTGWLLKRSGVFRKSDGDILLKAVFYLSLPALILKSLSSAELSEEYLFLPFIPPVVILISYLAARIMVKILKLTSERAGVFVVGSMILNIAFSLPFIIAVYGDEGLARIMIMDLGNGIMIFSFVYLQACKYGRGGQKRGSFFLRFLKAPPVWALLAALALNIAGFRFTGVAEKFLTLTGDLTIPLLMLSVGIFFEFRIIDLKSLVSLVFIRMGLGALLAFVISQMLGLEGLTRMVVFLGVSTPIGYNTLTFSSVEKLDSEFAASAVSISILIGMVWYPVLIFLLN